MVDIFVITPSTFDLIQLIFQFGGYIVLFDFTMILYTIYKLIETQFQLLYN